MEHKTFPALVTKVDAEQGIVDAIVAVMGNCDQGDDVIHNGAFSKTITERGMKIRVLDQHNTDSIMRVIGKPLAMREMGRAELPPELLSKYPEATGGLWTSTQYLMNTPEGKGAFERIKVGAVDEYSIGYDTVKGGLDYSKGADGRTVRNLRELKLYEYSPVLWGMNEATSTLSAKEKCNCDQKADYPWDECISDQMERYGDEETARQVCGAIRARGKTYKEITDEERAEIEKELEIKPKKSSKAMEQEYTGAMVAFFLPDDVSAQLAVPGPGALAPSELHITLAFLGDTVMGDIDKSALLTAVGNLASRMNAISGTINGIGRFVTNEGEGDAFYATFDAPWLMDFRTQLVWDLEMMGISCMRNHGFTPHITLAYIPRGSDTPNYLPAPIKLTFDTVYLAWGNERIPFKLAYPALKKGEGLQEIKAGRVLAARNAQRILSAMSLLQEALKDAGMMDMPEDEEDEEEPAPEKAADKKQADNLAGPEEPPTSDLLKLIEIHQSELSLLEV